MRGAASLANCNLLIKGFGNAIDGDACTGAAQRSGDGVAFHGVKVVQQGVARMRCGSKKLWLNKFALLIRRTSDPWTPF